MDNVHFLEDNKLLINFISLSCISIISSANFFTNCRENQCENHKQN